MAGGPAPYPQLAQVPDHGYGPQVDGGYDPAGDYVGYETFGGEACNDCIGGTGLPPRAYGSFDVMYMWRKGAEFPTAVLTTSDPADRGIRGEPSTRILFGGNEQDDPHLGGRITLGLWLDDYQDWSVGTRFLALEQQSLGYTATSDEYGTLAFPFFNTDSGLNDAILVALPGAGIGAADNTTVRLQSENEVYLGDIFVTKHLYTNHGNRWDFVTGYSYAKIDDVFRNRTTFTSQDLGGGAFSAGDVVNIDESFAGVNEFHGGQFGLMAEFQDGPFTWRALGKISIGGMRQEARISGSTTVNGSAAAENIGFAADSIQGSYGRNVFAYIPEVNTDLIYAYNCNLDFKIGATFVYFSDVVTGGSLINTNIDPTGTTGDPEFSFNEQEYWLLGMNFGIEYHY